MRRRSLIACMIAAGAVMLGACSDSKDIDASKLDRLKSKMEQENAATSGDEKAEEKPEVSAEDNAPEETVSAGLFADAFANGEVENNGGLFVRVGSRVYYRVYGTRALALTSYGEPFIDESNANVASTLMYYDLDTDENIEAATVYGIGPLYACTAGICFMSYPDGIPSTTLVDEDGNVDEDYLTANITGVSADGRSISVNETDDDDYINTALYRDGKRLGSPAADNGDISRFNDLGFCGSSLIGVAAFSDGKKSICSYDENGNVTMLGMPGEYDMETYTLSPSIEGLSTADGKGYITVSYRDGTANMPVAWAVYGFEQGAEGSLKEYESGDIKEYNGKIPQVSVSANGEAVPGRYRAGDVYLSDGSRGDLMCLTLGGEEVTVYKDYIYDDFENAQYRTAIEAGICFDGGAVFVIKVNADRAPEEDAGIHKAYDLNSLCFECYRYDDEHKNEYGPQFTQLADISSAGWDRGEIDYDRLIGSWELRSANVEGFDRQDYKDDPTVQIITFNADGTGVISRIDRKTGKKFRDDRPIHQVEPDEYGADYAFDYETDDADPEQIGICFLSGGRLGIHHLYHYDGTSTGWYMGSYVRVQ